MVILPMLFSRFLALLLICCVTIREDFSFLVPTLSCDFTFHAEEAPVACEPGDALFACDDDSEMFGGGFPTRDEWPSDQGEIPVILEIDVDPEAEEVLCLGDSNDHFGFVSKCFNIEHQHQTSSSFTSFCTLQRLRI